MRVPIATSLLILGCSALPAPLPPTVRVQPGFHCPEAETQERTPGRLEACFDIWRVVVSFREQADSAEKTWNVGLLVQHLRELATAILEVEKAAAEARLYENALQISYQHAEVTTLLKMLDEELAPPNSQGSFSRILIEMEYIAYAVHDAAIELAEHESSYHADAQTRERAACLHARLEAFSFTDEELTALRQAGMEQPDRADDGLERSVLKVRNGLMTDAAASMIATERALPELEEHQEELHHLWSSVKDRCQHAR